MAAVTYAPATVRGPGEVPRLARLRPSRRKNRNHRNRSKLQVSAPFPRVLLTSERSQVRSLPRPQPGTTRWSAEGLTDGRGTEAERPSGPRNRVLAGPFCCSHGATAGGGGRRRGGRLMLAVPGTRRASPAGRPAADRA